MMRNVAITPCFSVLLTVFLLLPAAASATDFQIARLATQLQYSSERLAHELRDARGYGSLRHHANRLSREAGQLLRDLERNRSQSRVRAQFRDISRRYQDLETAFLRGNRQQGNPRLFDTVGSISNIYSALSSEIYYSGYVEPAPQVYYFAQPQQRRSGVRPGNGAGVIVSPPQQRQQTPGARRDRRDYGRIRALKPPRYEHRSNVLERQARQNRLQDRQLNRQAERNGATGQRYTGRRNPAGRSLETGRRNRTQ